MIRIVGRVRKTLPLEKESTVGAISKGLQLTESAYITLKNGLPVTSDEPVAVDDDLVFMEVFSGG